MRFFIFCVMIFGILHLGGCGNNSPQPVQVTGKVTMGGVPLEKGFIYFKTLETGALERLEIQGGSYAGKALPGLRRVEIISNVPKKVVIDGATVEVPENIIHPSFNTESKLTAEVSTKEPNSFNFDVKKK